MLKKYITNEYAHFQTLSPRARKLFISSTYFGFGSVLIDLFIGAYIWGKTSDMAIVTYYFLGNFITLPLFFIVNGYLLRKFNIKNLYALGLIIQGLIPLLLVLLGETDYTMTLFLGLVNGIGMAFFWANRNYLVIESTSDSERNYYFGVSLVVSTIAGVVIPFMAGLFFEFSGELWGINKDEAYFVLMFVIFLLFLYSAFILHKGDFHNPNVKKLTLDKADWTWWLVRILTLLHSISFGLLWFVPVLMVLILVGDEGALGTIQALSALATAVVVYFLARKTKPEQRFGLFVISLIIASIAYFEFALFYTAFAVIVYKLLTNIERPMTFISIEPMWYEAMEKNQHHAGEDYKFITDLEIQMNIGRIIGIILFLWLLDNWSDEVALRVIPIVLIVINVLAFGVGMLLNQLLRSHPSKLHDSGRSIAQELQDEPFNIKSP